MLTPMLFLAAVLPAAGAPERQVQNADNATLGFAGAVLCNNVFNKGTIQDARQEVYTEGAEGGWTWDWPEGTGPAIKAYPEIILGRSPWLDLRGGTLLPAPLGGLKLSLDFDFTAQAEGSWCTSFDFWITGTAEPKPQDITCNLNIWIQRDKLSPPYKGKRETVVLGGRTYEAIIETPADAPHKTWPSLCLVDTEPRTAGSIDLGEIVAFLIARGLAKPEFFLATAELGNEVAYGKGRTVVRRFTLQ